jgi:hypothetical protein
MSEDLIKVVLDYSDDNVIDTGLFKIIHKGEKDDLSNYIPNNP